jgi:Zn-dependent protease/predicted transcriptional regulator
MATNSSLSAQRSPARTGWPLGRPFGIELVADWSLLLIFALVVFDLGAGTFPAWHPDWSPALAWTIAVLAGISFFASIALHELAHALVGRRHGVPVRRITLFVFGGMAEMEREPKTPRAELWMAIAGPLTSLAIGLFSVWIGSVLLGNPAELTNDPMQAIRDASPLASALLWLGPVNLWLALFNLIPGFPLDGGRVLRAIVWAATKDLRKATRFASLTGQAFAWMLMSAGALLVLGQELPWFGRGVGSGMWLLLIGWFLNNAARMSFQNMVLREGLGDVTLRDVMRDNVLTVPQNLTVNELVHKYILGSDQRAFPVVKEDGALLGLVRPSDVRKVPREHWNQVLVSGVMVPAEQLRVMSPDDDAIEALQELADQDAIPVVDQRHLVGVARRDDLVKWLTWHAPRA